MKKIISIFLLLAFVISLVPASGQELPDRDFFIDSQGNPQCMIVLSETATAKDIEKVTEVITRLTNETEYSTEGTKEQIVWESKSFVEDDSDNVALGYTGIKSNPDWVWEMRSFTTPAYFYSHGSDPAPAWPNCPFYVESVEALFDGDRNTRIVGRTGYDFFGPNYAPVTLIVKFNETKEISDFNFTFENLPVAAGYQIYYYNSDCPNTLYNPSFWMYGATGNWALLPVSGGWPKAGSALKKTDTFSLTQTVKTNALLIELNPYYASPPNASMPYSLYEFEVKGRSFSMLYGNTYYIDFTWADKTGLDKNQLKHLDYWVEDVKETLPGDFIQTAGKSYSTETSRYNLITKQVNLLRMYRYNEDKAFPDKTVGRVFYGTPLTWEDEEFKVGETKTYGEYKVKLVDINWDKSQTTVNFDHKRGSDYLGEKKVTVEVTDPEGIVKRHIMTVDCCDDTLAELFVSTDAESEAATNAICRLKSEGYLCDITPVIFRADAADPLYLGLASDHMGAGAAGNWPSYAYIYGYGYDASDSTNYPTLIFNGNKSKAIQDVPPNTEDAYYEAFKGMYEANVSGCCDAKIVINTNMDPERFSTAKDKEALVSVRLNKDLPNTELYLNVWGITCDCCAPVATGLVTSQYWQSVNKWSTECSEKVTDTYWKDLKSGDVYRTEINLCGTDYCGIVAVLQDKNTGKIYGSAIRHFTPSPGANLSPDIASSDCQCVVEYNKDLDCDNLEEEVEFAIEGADVAFVGMEHDLEKNIDGEIKKNMIARFNIYSLTDYGCIDDCDCNYISNDGSKWKLKFMMNDGNLYNPYVDRCSDCTKDLRSIKIELCEPITFGCLKEGAVFWGPNRYFRVYVEDYDEESQYVKYKVQRVNLFSDEKPVNTSADPKALIKTDKEITSEDRAKYNMILIGNKETNLEIERLNMQGDYTESDGMSYIEDVYGKKDILVLNSKETSDLNEPIRQLTYLLDLIF